MALLALLWVLMIGEEMLAGAVHGKSASAVLAEYGSVWPEHAATALLVGLILLPLVSAIEFARARGTTLIDLLVDEARGSEARH